jgi:predicted secreted protein
MYDKEVFSRPIKDLLKEPAQVLETWIETNERFILEGVKRAALRDKYKTKSIKEFYKVILVSTEVQTQRSV